MELMKLYSDMMAWAPTMGYCHWDRHTRIGSLRPSCLSALRFMRNALSFGLLKSRIKSILVDSLRSFWPKVDKNPDAANEANAPLTGRHRDASNGVRTAYRGLEVEEDLPGQL